MKRTSYRERMANMVHISKWTTITAAMDDMNGRRCDFATQYHSHKHKKMSTRDNIALHSILQLSIQFSFESLRSDTHEKDRKSPNVFYLRNERTEKILCN